MKNPRALNRSLLGYSNQEVKGRKGEKTEAEEAGGREEESIRWVERMRKIKKTILLFKSLPRDGNAQIVSLNK